MDPETSKIVYFFTQFWSFLAVSVAVSMGGMAAKRIVAVLVPAERKPPAERKVAADSRGGPYRVSAYEVATDVTLPLWYRLWRATISMHPVIVGGLAGLAPIPTAEWVPESAAAHVLWFGLAGALSGQIFEVGRRLTEILPAIIRQRLGVSTPPAAATPDSPPEPGDSDPPGPA